jgi:hypothetical protein
MGGNRLPPETGEDKVFPEQHWVSVLLPQFISGINNNEDIYLKPFITEGGNALCRIVTR